MNKGKVLRLCPECKRKRFCSKEPIPGTNYRFTCSKGHKWVIKGITTERVTLAMKEAFSSEKVKSLFECDDIFFRSLKK